MKMLRSTLTNILLLVTAVFLALAILVRDGDLTAWRYLVELLDFRASECRTLTAVIWRGQTWALHEDAKIQACSDCQTSTDFADEAVRFEALWRRFWRARAMDLEAT